MTNIKTLKTPAQFEYLKEGTTFTFNNIKYVKFGERPIRLLDLADLEALFFSKRTLN